MRGQGRNGRRGKEREGEEKEEMQHNEAGRTVDGGGGNWIGGDRCEGEVSDEGGRGEEWKSLMEEYEMAIEKEGARDRWVKRGG